MKQILVPTDFSAPARLAAEVASRIALRSGAVVILLHVVELPQEGSFNIEGETSFSGGWDDKIFTLKLIEKKKAELAAAVESVASSGASVRSELRLGNPFHGITQIINDQQVDLVVMGTEGHSKLEEMLIGSNTEKVVRQSRCPVLTVHPRTVSADFKNIIYATSLLRDEETFVQVAAQVQALYDATLHIVWINTPVNFQPDHVAKRAMLDFATRLRIKNYTLNVFSDFSEEEGIIHFAESIDADLIAMATHGRRGFAHLLAGSIAEDVVNHTKRPVLTYVTKA
ncbi:MAG TPA: universal stress protein [Ohtaekwangia sp.]|nr:universal stress protein [Ohtaekwangia sp.]